MIGSKRMIFSQEGDSESAFVRTVETSTKTIVNLTDVLTKLINFFG